MAENENVAGYMSPEDTNRMLSYLYVGETFEHYVEDQHPEDEATARAIWDETLQWMENNPLQPGQVWGMVPE